MKKRNKGKGKLGNELGNRMEESVMQDSDRMNTWQQGIGEDDDGIMERGTNMKGIESGVGGEGGCHIWVVIGWLMPQGRESIASLIFSFFCI